MEKPIELVIEETQDAIIEVINESHLPGFILLPVMEKLTDRVRAAAEMQKNETISRYRKSLETEDDTSEADGPEDK